MAFWDTSAIVALCAHLPEHGGLRRLAGRNRRIVVWWGTPVETRSALFRLARENAISRQAYTQTLERFGVLRLQWDEVAPSERLRGLAESLPERLGLRAGDAFQLAAALVWCDERPRRRPFISLDRRLRQAAAALGFAIEGRMG